MSLLEDLYAAHASTGGDDYYFIDYTRCTCGHIYAASRDGRFAKKSAKVMGSKRGRYHAMLEAVAEANPELRSEALAFGRGAVGIVSTMTGIAQRRWDVSHQEAAVRLLDNAIHMVEERERADMLNVVEMSTRVEPVVEPVEVEDREPVLA